ncbi:MAG: hypothetical protein A2669_02425 [Candidatus Yanofskybacteria bacterium RIFCSPHIGHO2_01_FULL_48_25b]|uniref:CBS domain-containing protein n=1 Tax=Candidatus Yanofskybacteria bacterium RIFCSPHIGHO2_01_FULL_48_25b TaxID=1802672 RepID=A0A1F8F1R7_9BACT|nr:MAG: hypothetical protein A2669_02425 [Candidatus Yanofskybacteria bacterium RIFCSPHIGHO2_01_FULL_48_25b]
MKTAAEIMNTNIFSITPEDSLIEAVDLIVSNNLSGLPVVLRGSGQERYLVGTLTNYDLVIRGSSIHLPTFLKLFHRIKIYKSDADAVKAEIRKISALKVKDAMNENPYYVKGSDSVFEVMDIFLKNMTTSLPVVSDEKILIGVIGRHEMVRFMGQEKIDARKFEDQLRSEEIINNFVGSFDKKFILVSKARVKFWLIASALFVLVGFAIAWMQILRINI